MPVGPLFRLSPTRYLCRDLLLTQGRLQIIFVGKAIKIKNICWTLFHRMGMAKILYLVTVEES